jgi:hypothetical protein
MHYFTAIGLVLALAGCKSRRGPNTDSPEDKLLFNWGQALVAGDKSLALTYWDLDLRQKLEAWEKQLKPLNNPEKQTALLATLAPRLGDAAALATVGDEAWAEVKDAAWRDELADGKCKTAAPDADDVRGGRGVIPKERKEMGQDLGAWVFDLRTAINWAPAFRVRCPSGSSFWIELAQRKRADPAVEQPLKILQVAK